MVIKPYEKRSFSLSDIFSDFILSEDEIKNKEEKEKIDAENAERLFRMSPKVDEMLNMSQKLDSILFQHAKAEAVKFKFGGILSSERKNINLLLKV